MFSVTKVQRQKCSFTCAVNLGFNMIVDKMKPENYN